MPPSPGPLTLLLAPRFKSNDGVIVIAATNFPETLDKALVRPGRFDRHVTVLNPDVKGRQEILESHFKNVPRSSDVDLKVRAAASRPAPCGCMRAVEPGVGCSGAVCMQCCRSRSYNVDLKVRAAASRPAPCGCMCAVKPAVEWGCMHAVLQVQDG